MKMYSGATMISEPFNREDVFQLLEEKAAQYESLAFIDTDPISIPHRYSQPADIEIAGFLAATIAWGQRVTLIRNANWLLDRMDDAPADFIRNFEDSDLIPFKKFVHRTFNGDDCLFFMHALKRILAEHGSIENAFSSPEGDVKNGIIQFRSRFLSGDDALRSAKHISDPAKNSASKRINMYIRLIRVVS